MTVYRFFAAPCRKRNGVTVDRSAEKMQWRWGVLLFSAL